MSISFLSRLCGWRSAIGLGLGLILVLRVGHTESLAQTLTEWTSPPVILQEGTFDNQEQHAEGQYYLRRQGSRVSATFTSLGTTLDDESVLFTLPFGYRPMDTVVREAEGWPLTEGDLEHTVMVPERFRLAIEPNGAVRYLESDPGASTAPLAYVLVTTWTSPEVSGKFARPEIHLEGHYALRRTGATVTGMLTTTRSPGLHRSDQVPPVVFQLPPGFRPFQPIPLAVAATDDAGMSIFRLRVDPSGEVVYLSSSYRDSGPPMTYRIPVSWPTEESLANQAQTPSNGVDLCTRNPAVQDALLDGLFGTAIESNSCASVTWSDLAAVEILDLEMGAGHPPLQQRDLEGLTGLTQLTLHSPQRLYEWWPGDLLVATPRLLELDLDLFSAEITDAVLRYRAPHWALVKKKGASLFGSAFFYPYRYQRRSRLTAELLSYAPQLERLTIRGLGPNVPSHLVAHNARLQSLDLGADPESLPEDFLHHNGQLQELTLRGFHLSTLPEDFLEHNPQLRRLTFHSNLLETLPKNFLQHNPQLRALTVMPFQDWQEVYDSRYYRISTRLPPQLLAHSPLLEELTLAGRDLGAMPTLAHNPRLRRLTLDFSRKSPLPSDLLAYSHELRHLSLHMTEGLRARPLRTTPKLESLVLILSKALGYRFLAGVPELKSLTIYGVYKRVPPDLLAFTPQLQSLQLSNLAIEPADLLVHFLPQLQSLTLDSLTLESLSATTSLAKALANTPALQTLNLTDYGLKALPPDLLVHTPRLQSLNLYLPVLIDLPLGLLAHTPGLRNLNLYVSDVKTLPVDLLAYTPELQSLEIDASELLALPSGLLNSTPQLQSLYLRHQRVEKVPTDLLQQVPALQALALFSGDWDSLSPHLLAPVPDLQSLLLSVYHPDDTHRNIVEDFTVHNTRLLEVHLIFSAPISLPAHFMSRAPHLQKMTFSAHDQPLLAEGFLVEAPLLREFEFQVSQELMLPPDFLSYAPRLQSLVIWPGHYARPLAGRFQHVLWHFPYLRMANALPVLPSVAPSSGGVEAPTVIRSVRADPEGDGNDRGVAGWEAPAPNANTQVVSGDYGSLNAHRDGQYDLRLTGERVEATFTTTRSPVQHWAREMTTPLFTVPAAFRPPYAIMRTVMGQQVRPDGTPDPKHPAPLPFRLLIREDGAVHYVDDHRAAVLGFMAYTVHIAWGTTPTADELEVLSILAGMWHGLGADSAGGRESLSDVGFSPEERVIALNWDKRRLQGQIVPDLDQLRHLQVLRPQRKSVSWTPPARVGPTPTVTAPGSLQEPVGRTPPAGVGPTPPA